MHEIASLIRHEPEKARRKLLAAFNAAKSVKAEVAKRFDVNVDTVTTWVKALRLEGDVEALRKKFSAHLHKMRQVNGSAGGKVGGWPLGKPRKPPSENAER